MFGEGLGGPPLGRSAGSCLFHHLVNLLQCKTLGLGHEEVGVDKGAGTETAPDEEDRRFEVASIGVDHVGSNNGDDSVPEPVGGCGEAHTSGADRERENLADQDPGTRSPSRGKEEDEDGNECNLGIDRRDVVGSALASSIQVGLVEADSNTNDGAEELADEHTSSSNDEERSPTELLNCVEGDGCRADVDQGEDQGDQESIADCAGRLQKWS